MGLKCQLFVLFALIVSTLSNKNKITIFSKIAATLNVAEPRRTDINPSLSNPNVKLAILNSILISRGTSLQRIQEVIISSEGNPQALVDGINAEIKDEVLRLEENEVKVNPDGIKRVLQESLQGLIRSKLPESSFASALEERVKQHIDAKFIDKNPLPLKIDGGLLRRRRSLQPREFDLGVIVSNIVGTVLKQELGGVIVELLNQVKEILNSLVITTASGDPLGDFFASSFNNLIKSLLQAIATLQDGLTVTPEPKVDESSRRKRDLTGSSDGILEGLIKPIITLLASVLTPVNTLVKNVSIQLLDILQVILGSTLITPIKNFVLALIDLLIPSNTV